jgi:outer membrane receptor protein involved in Fe transport
MMTGALLLMVATLGARAEEDFVELNDTSKVVDLDEVVVVSQPKEATLLRLQPVSSNLFGASEMQRLQVRDLRELSAYVPSFSMPQYGSRLTSSIYMRGTGSRMNAAASSVPVYYDHIPLMSKSAFNSHFYMLDRVDVLRGPQATLYGMNSEGGLVRIYSKDPMRYQGTDIALGVGNHFQRKAEVAHFHRPSENFAFSVAGFYQGQDGFFDNTNLNEKNDKGNEAGAKVRLMWQMTSRLKADLTADYQFTKENAFPYGLYDIANDEVALPATTFMNTYRRQMLNTGLNLTYELDRLRIASTTSYQHLYDYMDMDQDYTPADRMSLMQHQKMNALTEELAVRTHDNSRWQWTTGVFAAYQHTTTDAPVTFGPALTGTIAKGIMSAMPSAVQSMFTTWEIPCFDVDETFKTPQTNLGIFHESNIELTDRLKATVGLRLDYMKAKVEYDSRGSLDLHYIANMMGTQLEETFTLTDSVINNTSKSTLQLLPKLGLVYLLGNHGSNIYVQLSKGYRAGGYNIQMFSDILQTEMQTNGKNLRTGDFNVTHDAAAYEEVNRTIEYEPETSWNFEVGAHLNLFDNRLKADIAAYYLKVSNLQLTKMARNYSFGRMMVNAGKSRSCGVELGLRGQAVDNRLIWAATYSMTHANFREYTDSVKVDGTMTEVDYKGNKVPFVPQHMFSGMVDYRFDITSDGLLRSLTLGVNVAGQGKTYWDEANTVAQKFYATMGAHAQLDMGAVSLDLWGRNLTDTRYATFGLAYSGGFIGQRGLPLQFGVDMHVHI